MHRASSWRRSATSSSPQKEDLITRLPQNGEFAHRHEKTIQHSPTCSSSSQDKAFYEKAIKILRSRKLYYQQVWAFGFKHNDEQAVQASTWQMTARCASARMVGKEFRLQAAHRDQRRDRICATSTTSPSLTRVRTESAKGIDRHQRAFLDAMAEKKEINAADRLVRSSTTYCCFDRVTEAIKAFNRHQAGGNRKNWAHCSCSTTTSSPTSISSPGARKRFSDGEENREARMSNYPIYSGGGSSSSPCSSQLREFDGDQKSGGREGWRADRRGRVQGQGEEFQNGRAEP